MPGPIAIKPAGVLRRPMLASEIGDLQANPVCLKIRSVILA